MMVVADGDDARHRRGEASFLRLLLQLLWLLLHYQTGNERIVASLSRHERQSRIAAVAAKRCRIHYMRCVVLR